MVDYWPPAAEEKQRTFMFNIRHRGLFTGVVQAAKRRLYSQNRFNVCLRHLWSATQHLESVCRCTHSLCHSAGITSGLSSLHTPPMSTWWNKELPPGQTRLYKKRLRHHKVETFLSHRSCDSNTSRSRDVDRDLKGRSPPLRFAAQKRSNLVLPLIMKTHHDERCRWVLQELPTFIDPSW